METFAASIITVLAPYVAAGAKKAVEVAGTAIAEHAGALLSRLREWFVGDEEAASVLEGFEKKPSRYGGVLEDILREKAKSDPARARELQEMMDAMGPRLEVIQKIRELAGEAVGLDLDKWEKGVATASQDVDVVKSGASLTGAKIRGK